MNFFQTHLQPANAMGFDLPNGSIDVRMIAVIRSILAISAVVIAHLDPTHPSIFSDLTYGSLIVYAAWSGLLTIIAFMRDTNSPPPRDSYWGDMFFSAYLVTLTQGTNSLFFSFFLFAILSASFSRGYSEGLLVTGGSVMLFILASLWFEPEARFGFDQTLVRPIYLLTLGYMISYWGGHEISQRRRLMMLQEVNKHLDSRIGYDDAIRLNLNRLLRFYDAKACVLVIQRPTSPQTYRSYFTSNLKPVKEKLENLAQTAMSTQKTEHRNTIDEETAQKVLNIPNDFSGCFEISPPWWKRYLPNSCPQSMSPNLKEKFTSLAHLLDSPCFLTAPYTQQDGTAGRLFITPGKHRFIQSDVDFITQLLMSISHIVESMQLMDELVSESAKHERFKISLDIHDTTIQPYIGLKLGLDALDRQAEANNPLKKDISELVDMTEATIQDLRRYVTMLRDDEILTGDSLVAAIKEKADRFNRFYKIDVKVKCNSEIRVNPHLANAVMQIFAEGLSNILRHTQTRHAYLSINCDKQNLLLEIANKTPEISRVKFTPRSINARALTLGGTSFVESDGQGYTVVHVNIPI